LRRTGSDDCAGAFITNGQGLPKTPADHFHEFLWDIGSHDRSIAGPAHLRGAEIGRTKQQGEI
jgi:hypothetical protein